MLVIVSHAFAISFLVWFIVLNRHDQEGKQNISSEWTCFPPVEKWENVYSNGKINYWSMLEWILLGWNRVCSNQCALREKRFFFKFKRFKWRDGVIFLGNNSQSKLSGKTKTFKKVPMIGHIYRDWNCDVYFRWPRPI